jgi:hypothetical protein
LNLLEIELEFDHWPVDVGYFVAHLEDGVIVASKAQGSYPMGTTFATETFLLDAGEYEFQITDAFEGKYVCSLVLYNVLYCVSYIHKTKTLALSLSLCGLNKAATSYCIIMILSYYMQTVYVVSMGMEGIYCRWVASCWPMVMESLGLRKPSIYRL